MAGNFLYKDIIKIVPCNTKYYVFFIFFSFKMLTVDNQYDKKFWLHRMTDGQNGSYVCDGI
jgi:hypothetical protein